MKNYKGLAYPIQKTTQGFFHGGDDIAQIKASMLTIIMTKPGERVFEPYFGTPIHQLNYNQPPELIADQLKQMIAISLNKWEKRYPVTNIEVKLVTGDAHIMVNFIDPVHLQQEHTLTLQLPL